MFECQCQEMQYRFDKEPSYKPNVNVTLNVDLAELCVLTSPVSFYVCFHLHCHVSRQYGEKQPLLCRETCWERQSRIGKDNMIQSLHISGYTSGCDAEKVRY